MNLKKKVVMLAVLGVTGVSAIAGATNIGYVNINQLVTAYPGYGALEMQARQVESQYGPQIQKEMEAINKMTDRTKQKEAYEKNVVPIGQKMNAAISKIMNPMLDTIGQKIDAVRVQKGLDVIVDTPASVVSADKNTPKPVDITADVAATLKK